MIDEILSMLDAEEYPEIYGYLSSQLSDEDDMIESDTLYDMAIQLLELDKPKDLPPYVIGMIEELFAQEINDGNAEAMNALGAQFYDGNRGFEQSFQKAAYYYTLAAENGSRQAQENLGYVYYYGRLGAPDYEKAFHYFALGAFDGHLISRYKIGDMYLHGLYVPQNEREAFHIFMHCLETMTPQAEPVVAGPVYLRLGRMLLNGTGTDKDVKGALVCFQRAESFLYDMVLSGNVMYKKSLASAIDGQSKARAELAEALPDEAWSFE